MIIIGLTGGMAMGKTTVARQFAALGIPVLDSDKVVHRLLAENKQVITKIRTLFPAAWQDGKIDRPALGKEVFGKEESLKKLEHILHPQVRREQDRFIRSMRVLGKWAVLLDIPLLFETRAEKRCDYTVAVSASDFLQSQRALKRAGMTREKLRAIRRRQLPDSEKRRRADFVVLTGLGKKESLKQVKTIVTILRKKHARNMP